MSGREVIPLNQNRRSRTAFPEGRTVAMLVFLVFDAMMFAGMVGIFMLTRGAAGAEWPPPGQPWFPPWETAINTTALLVSGLLVLRANLTWEKPEARVGPLLFAAIVLGAFFLFFQGVIWLVLIRQGLNLASSQYGAFFCLVVFLHAVNVLGGLILLGIAWRRLNPLSDDQEMRGPLRTSAFSSARILWYFVAGVWPILYLTLFL